MPLKPMTYTDVGVDYNAMDLYKREAQVAARTTDHFVERFGFKVVEWSRGESTFLIETPWGYLGFLVEGLGTKNRVSDRLKILAKMRDVARELTHLVGKTFYDQIGQCNVAMAVNDMVTLGTMPISIGQYLAVGHGDWFKDEKRRHDLIEGTRRACELARCSWGPGETPTLKGIILTEAADLAGAAQGWLADKSLVMAPSKIAVGDIIMLIGSSGIHANYLSMARAIAKKLPKQYLTELPDGRTYGETLLDPTHIYVGLVEDCLNAGVQLHYGVNITGHGWRKLMRAPQPLTYRIKQLPPKLPIFDFIIEHGPITRYEAYGNMNMGAGFALYCPASEENDVITIADQHGFCAFNAGTVEESDEKRVIIEPEGLRFESDSLYVR
jgi:phosphoribosylformylglycinamidine cyclo-ligase